MFTKVKNELINPFSYNKRIYKSLLIVFLLVNGLVLINVFLHNPTVNYDGRHHLKNIEIYSQLRFPNQSDSREFFSPPLPYFFPSLLIWSGLAELMWAVKFAQFVNVLLSIALTFYLLKLCDLIKPDSKTLKISSLGFLGILPIYYKTFSFPRGEPFVAFFTVFVAYQISLIFIKYRHTPINIIALGFALGLGVLARQWMFLLFPGFILFVILLSIKNKEKRFQLSALLVSSLVISFLVGSWFYLRLYREYGTFTAFNRDPDTQFSFANQPPEFYFGLGLDQLFKDPIRPSFPNQFFPIFYSEMWGDYWCYFDVYGYNAKTGELLYSNDLQVQASRVPPREWFKTNRFTINSYLGRVNLIAILPSLFYILGFPLGLLSVRRFIFTKNVTLLTSTSIYTLLSLLMLTSIVGYAWFLVGYPNLGKGDTIKATYMIHLFPLAAILAARFLEFIRNRSKLTYKIVVVLLIFTFFHNLPVMLTNYVTIGISTTGIEQILFR